jgi:hypothetical protein
VYQPYFQFFNFTSRWSFFAPDPGTRLLHLEWELLGKNNEQIEYSRFPLESFGVDSSEIVSNAPNEFRSKFTHSKSFVFPLFQHEQEMRELSLAHLMAESDTRAEEVLIPYLCHRRLNPGDVVSVRLWRVIDPLPTQSEVLSGRQKAGDHFRRERQWIAQRFCRDVRI